MEATIRKKASKLYAILAFMPLLGFAYVLFLDVDEERKAAVLVAYAVSFLGLSIPAFVVPFFSRIFISKSEIKKITKYGGLIKIDLKNLDMSKSFYDSRGIFLKPVSGEPLFLASSSYREEDLRRIYSEIEAHNKSNNYAPSAPDAASRAGF